MTVLQWAGEIITLLILIGSAFIAGVAIGDKESESKR